ncbi:hypothetical protein HY633_05340 [Candidatus Uhrbacteria bacterium]|nr:hypothetical protein [Candidatus Uhrbacteria bacterium]
MTLASLAQSVSLRERRAAAVLIVLAMLLSSIPPIFALMTASANGMAWSGMQFLSPGDISVYLSYIEQVKQGRWLFGNFYTTEPLAPVFNIFWLAIGLFSRVLRLDALLAYHLARLALIPVFGAVAYLFVAFVLPRARHRVFAFGLFFFSSGVGEYFSPLFLEGRFDGSRYQWPIDLWVAESNAFLSMLYSPHFIASWTLILACFLLLLMAFESGRDREAVLAGALALLLFQFHPFHAPTLYFAPLVFAAMRVRWGASIRRLARPYLIFVGISSPSVLYHYYLTHYDANAGELLANNLTLTPGLPLVLLGFGLITLFAPIGYYIVRRVRGDHARWDFLAAWALAQFILAYSPLTFQRRLLEGLQFPLVLLAVPAMLAFGRRLESRLDLHKVVIAAFACFFLLPSTASALVNGVGVIKTPQPSFYFDRDTRAAFAWLKEYSVADAVVLAMPDSGYEIAGWAGRRVYSGHWAMTIDAGRKHEELRGFFSNEGVAGQRRQLIDLSGADYVFWGPRERETGGAPAATWKKVFESGETAVYEITAGI